MENKMDIACKVVALPDKNWQRVKDGKDYTIEWTRRCGGWVRMKKNTTNTAWAIKYCEFKHSAEEEAERLFAMQLF